MLIDRVVNFFTSLRLTVVLLCLGLVLVFAGTLAQVDLGLYKAQNEFFRSFFIYWGPKSADWKIPVFPGGYLVGGFLLVNLISAHIKRFKFEWKKTGILMIHAGLILMLLGQLLTDLLARESSMRMHTGETRNYSESDRQSELAVIDATDPDTDKVVAIPESVLGREKVIRHPELPFSVQVNKFFANSTITTNSAPGFEKADVTQGGDSWWWKEEPKVTTMDMRDLPSAVIELVSPQGSLGKWLVSELLRPQTFTLGNRTYQIGLRLQRHYKPFSLHLERFDHKVFKGTDMARDFSSHVRLQNPNTGEDREVRIYMNNPLRYQGETFYQASFDKFDDQVTILQVVKNPSWLTPYFSCMLVGLGMVVQFGMHLFGFIKKRMKK